MARRESSKKNLLLLQDNLSDSTLGLYYRTPTTKERQAYINNRSKRLGKKFVDNSAANRVDSGKRILTGLREGDFERAVGDDQYQPIATEPGHKDFYEDWPNWMEEHCSDVLTMLAIRVFELSVTPGSEEETEVEGEDVEDLEKK
jgi:hypothetical protein